MVSADVFTGESLGDKGYRWRANVAAGDVDEEVPFRGSGAHGVYPFASDEKARSQVAGAATGPRR